MSSSWVNPHDLYRPKSSTNATTHGQERYWSNEDHAEIRVMTIKYGEERYPYEYEQEVA